ncbi:MAG TPA: hypothetical protein PLY93_09795 [Turneriella sp.]|nr:hypothetical protein [Turneriella sp.]
MALQKKYRLWLQTVGVALLVSFLTLLFFQQRKKSPDRVALGEEVYASHDCTDCHIDTEKLREKKNKKEVGLIRVRFEKTVLTQFLSTDPRHTSYTLMTDEDRANLIEYLTSLVVKK